MLVRDFNDFAIADFFSLDYPTLYTILGYFTSKPQLWYEGFLLILRANFDQQSV